MSQKMESETDINDQFEQFLQLRQQVRRMQAGTPLLLRTEEDGTEDLKICTFWVSEDLHKLCWQDNDSNMPSQDIQIAAIEAIVAEPDAADSDHASISLQLRDDDPMELICATSEDFSTWKDGLEFLSGDANPPSGAVAPPSEASEITEASLDTADQTEEELLSKLKSHQQANNMLKRDCETLREASARKDATISRLLADLQGKDAGNARYNKTASSSRESDAHLAEREIEILNHKNKQLQAALAAKQETITELMDLLRRCLQRQALVSEAEADGPFDKSQLQGLHAAVGALEARVGASLDEDSAPSSKSSSPVGVKQQSRSNFNPPPRQSPKATPMAAWHIAAQRSASATAERAQEESTDDSAEREALQSVLQDIAHLSDQLGRLEKDAETQPGNAKPSPPRSPAGKQPSLKVKGSSSAARRQSALDSLHREMDILREKKNAVETLAKHFERSCRED